MTSWTDAQLQCARNLAAIYRKYKTVPQLLGIAVNLQECGLNDGAVNEQDPGTSIGPFQLNQVAHPGSAFVASNPWYDYGFPEVAARWTNAYDQLGGDAAWGRADFAARAAFCEEFAPRAQGSDGWTPGLGVTRLQQAIDVLIAIS